MFVSFFDSMVVWRPNRLVRSTTGSSSQRLVGWLCWLLVCLLCLVGWPLVLAVLWGGGVCLFCLVGLFVGWFGLVGCFVLAGCFACAVCFVCFRCLSVCLFVLFVWLSVRAASIVWFVVFGVRDSLFVCLVWFFSCLVLFCVQRIVGVFCCWLRLPVVWVLFVWLLVVCLLVVWFVCLFLGLSVCLCFCLFVLLACLVVSDQPDLLVLF